MTLAGPSGILRLVVRFQTRSPRFAVGSSSVVFAAPLSTFCRCQPGPQGTSRCEMVPLDLRLVFRVSVSARGASPCDRSHSPHPPLVRFAECAPPPTSSVWSTPGDVAASVGRGSPARCPTRSALVVSHHLDGFLHTRSSGLVASRYRKGFAAFRACAYRLCPTTRGSLAFIR